VKIKNEAGWAATEKKKINVRSGIIENLTNDAILISVARTTYLIPPTSSWISAGAEIFSENCESSRVHDLDLLEIHLMTHYNQDN
jgi:hypothetical protein